jgi:hypothetical protein
MVFGRWLLPAAAQKGDLTSRVEVRRGGLGRA